MENNILEDKPNNRVVTIVKICIALLIAVLSFTYVAKVTSSQDFHKKSIEVLDQKKTIIMQLSTGAAAVAISTSLILGDRVEPIADKFLDMTSYLLVILCAVLLEKYLITILGFASFKIILPIAMLLYIVFLINKNEGFKKVAQKLALFAVIIFCVIPMSVFVSNMIEKTYVDDIQVVIDSAKKISEDATTINEEASSEASLDNNVSIDKSIDDGNILERAKGIINSAKAKVGTTVTNIGNTITKKAKEIYESSTKMLSNLLEAIAVMFVTTCIVPVITVFLFIWLINIFFNLNIKIHRPKIEKQ